MKKISIEKFYEHKEKIGILCETKEELEKFCKLSNKSGKTQYILVEFTQPVIALNTGYWQRLSHYEEIFLKPENRFLKKYELYKLEEMLDENNN